MQKTFNFFYAFLLAILGFGVTLMAEDITLTTYYPAPYGAYEELTVTGNVGIGTTAPDETISPLDVTASRGAGIFQGVPSIVSIINSNTAASALNGLVFYGVNSSGINYPVGGVGVRQTPLGGIASGDMVFATTDTGGNIQEKMIILANGNVGIGTLSPGNYRLNVSGDIWCNGDFYDGFMTPVVENSWPVWMNYGTGRFGTPPTSSIRYKENIVTLDTALEYVKALRPVYFDYKADYLPNATHQIGLIAEEAASVDPLLAIYRDGRPDDVNYKAVTAFLIKAVQELDRHEGHVNKNGEAYTNPDYVFEPGYNLSVTELKDYVFENKHLPNLPSADEIKQDGVKLFEQNRLLLEKLEEAYLHIFKLEERITKLESITQKER